MKTTIFLSASLALAFGLFGCGSGDKPSETATTTGTTTSKPTGSKKHKLAFVTNNASDYWTIARKGVEKAQSELPNVEVDFKMPADGTAAAQRAIVDDMMAKGVEGMAISPVDPANQTDMINSAAAKALVITQDSDAPLSNRSCYIGTDNFAAGKQAGEELKKALPNGGKIMIFVGKADAQNAKDRIGGIKEAIAGSKIVVLDVRTDDTDRARAKSNAADVLTKEGDIAALVGIWSYNGPAILSAVTDANKIGKVKIVCFDEEDDTLAGVKSGAIDSTIVQQPFEFGYQAILMMNKFLDGDKTVFPENKLHIISTVALSKDTVDDFKAKLDKLRGR
ncbi:MAG: sugar-binding protein [Armatimonadetes bacterium]|nr:sugar-binding protein [Armatimonadota bacterium]